MPAGWPDELDLRGVTESVVTTPGPNGRWNLAALGLHTPEGDGTDGSDPLTARTWGHTRTRRNFAERGTGYVQFTRDSRTFVDAALAVREVEDPVLDDADAWVRVTVERIGAGESGGTDWMDWALDPVESQVMRRSVPTTNRGYYAVVEATVAASRLDVDGYDRAELLDRLRYLESVVRTAGGPAEREAFDRLEEYAGADW
jgi:hypothetical protein